MYHVPDVVGAGLVVSPNLKYVHEFPATISPEALVVTVGNSGQSARSWAHCCVVGFQVKPRLEPPEGVAVGLMRTLT